MNEHLFSYQHHEASVTTSWWNSSVGALMSSTFETSIIVSLDVVVLECLLHMYSVTSCISIWGFNCIELLCIYKGFCGVFICERVFAFCICSNCCIFIEALFLYCNTFCICIGALIEFVFEQLMYVLVLEHYLFLQWSIYLICNGAFVLFLYLEQLL